MITKAQFVKYVNAVADLGDSLKKDIIKDGMISDNTILALNKLVIISNEIIDVTDEIRDPKQKVH